MFVCAVMVIVFFFLIIVARVCKKKFCEYYITSLNPMIVFNCSKTLKGDTLQSTFLCGGHVKFVPQQAVYMLNAERREDLNRFSIFYASVRNKSYQDCKEGSSFD